MYGRRGVLHLLLYCTLFVPFSLLFLGQVIFPYSMAVYVFVVCMYVSVWCGGAPLSLSLWNVAGMVIAWQDSRADGEAEGPQCNCGDAEKGNTGRDILVRPNLSCRFQCFTLDCINQCIMVFPCCVHNMFVINEWTLGGFFLNKN